MTPPAGPVELTAAAVHRARHASEETRARLAAQAERERMRARRAERLARRNCQ